MVLHAGLAALLTRLGAGSDIAIGSPIAGRTDSALDDLIGFFVNTLVLRTDTSGNPSFRELVARVRASNLLAYSHQDVPFERLVAALNPARSLSRHPLFQVMLALQNNADVSFELTGLSTALQPLETASAKFDLSLSLREQRGRDGTPEGIIGAIEYATDLFDRRSAERLADRFIRLLEAAVAQPEQAIGSLDILSAEERDTILQAWNDTGRPLPSTNLLELFAAQAAAGPDAIAVVFEEQSLTYSALDRHANQLAHYLRALGVCPEVTVGLCLERSLDMIIGLIGILKAGGAYLPLDPSYPQARLAFMLEDAGVSVLVTHSRLVDQIPTLDIQIVRIDADAALIAAQPTIEPTLALDPQHPAYVIYTSGSTGMPKGIVMPHGPLANLVSWSANTLRGEPQSRVAQLTPISFDVSVQEIFSALISGKTLFAIRDNIRSSPPDLLKWLVHYKISELFVPNPIILGLSEAIIENGLELPNLAHIAQAGEALTLSENLEKFCSTRSRAQLHNHYGPTETHVAASYRFPRDTSKWPSVGPIGRPIWNTRVYVLNDCLQPVPAGVAGELYIAGAGLARGYLWQVALTAERFVADPFGSAGGRMYRTGDLVRWRADGVLDFLGRVDAQVKLRGFRIEPGEIEAVLMRHAAVAQAAVIAHTDRSGDKRLIAYVVIKGGGDGLDVAVLRIYTSQMLPSHMVPSAFIVLPALPLTPNDKVDRKALPPPHTVHQRPPLLWTPPRTPTEEVLAGLWESALPVKHVGIHDDFFQLGGHSILALRLIHEINFTFGLELPVRLFFTATTVAAQAHVIESARAVNELNQGPYGTLVPLCESGDKPPFFLVIGGFGGEAELLVYARLIRFLDHQRPFYGLRARGVDDLVNPHRTVQEMAAEHLNDIRKIQPHGPYFIGGGCSGGMVALEIAQQLHSQGEVVASLILVDSSVPSWRTYLRYRLFRIWSEEVLPLLQSWRLSPAHFHAMLKEKIMILTAPSSEQRVGREKIRIGLKYLRRLMHYSQRPYAGPATLILCAERKARDPARRWRALVLGGLDVHYVPGDHFTHLREHAADTAACLDACLETAYGRLHNSHSSLS